MLNRAEIREAPIEAEGFLRAVAAEYFHRVDNFLAELMTLPQEWDEGWTMSDWTLRLTVEEAEEPRTELIELAQRYRDDKPGTEAPEGAERVVLHVQVLPMSRSDEPVSAHATD